MPKLLTPTDTAWLYVIGEKAGPYKLGFSTQPRSRLKALRLETKRDLKLLWWVETPYKTARSVELMAHKLLAEYERDGEWFTAPFNAVVDASEVAVLEYPKIEHPLRPKAAGTSLAFRADDALLNDIDNWRRGAEGPAPSRAGAILALVKAGLEAQAERRDRGAAKVGTYYCLD